ncbi:MAG: hypothetical protein KGJ07_09030, partial [Patescibacteria group bacterium]|nr:hypothetical protein [Patescibacteria group bacterium]
VLIEKQSSVSDGTSAFEGNFDSGCVAIEMLIRCGAFASERSERAKIFALFTAILFTTTSSVVWIKSLSDHFPRASCLSQRKVCRPLHRPIHRPLPSLIVW